MSKTKQDTEKQRYWEKTIREAARSGVSVREFCQRGKLNVGQFYWWRRRLERTRQERTIGKPRAARGQTSFALVSDEAQATDAGIELVLGDGRRLRISKGVDEETLRAVLAAVEAAGC